MVIAMWRGTGYNKNVILKQHRYSDGSLHFEFRDRAGRPSNPTSAEAEQIIKAWRLEYVK